MTTKNKSMVPAFVAIIVLMFVAVIPYVATDEDKRPFADNDGKNMPVQVGSFMGSIEITEDSTREKIISQVTVSLSEVADGLDVYKAHLGIVVNENDDKFLIWILVNFEKDYEF
ncbi:MAG: hypothetical protein OEQ12_00575 [Nitrosopumilus sp.]|nr:hypothetical protein [Nitrosopumilus sp.]